MIIYVFYCDPHRFLNFATDTHRQTQTLPYWVVIRIRSIKCPHPASWLKKIVSDNIL